MGFPERAYSFGRATHHYFVKLFVLAAACLFVVGSASVRVSAADEKNTVNLLVVSVFERAIKEIIPVYERAHPGVHIQPTYAGAVALRGAVASDNAPGDMILIGATSLPFMAGKIGPAVEICHYRQAILVLRTGSKVHELKDFANPGMRLAGPTKTSAAFAYMHEVLSKASAEYGADFEKKVMANMLVSRPSSGEVLSVVETGSVDAGIDYTSDVSEKVTTIAIPDRFNVVTTGEGALIKSGEHAAAAKDLLEFLQLPQAKAIFHKNHLDTP
jgi:molybdate transport system substrate-binding protein